MASSASKDKMNKKMNNNYKSNKKIEPIDCNINLYKNQQDFLLLESNLQNCRERKHKQQKQTIIIHKWIFNQLFIANCDQNYLLQSRMPQIIKLIVAPKQQQQILSQFQQPYLSFKMFKRIQKSLPAPKLFNNHYISFQRRNLQNNRFQMRSKRQNKKKEESYESKNINNLNYNSIQVGEKVWAFCQICQHLHSGKILSTYKDSYLINFNRSNLGALKTPEFWVTTKLPLFCKEQNFKEGLILSNQKKINTVNFSETNLQAFCFYKYLIEMKKQLMRLLRNYNNKAQLKRQQSEVLTQLQLQQYGWIGCMISLVSIACKYIQNNFSILSCCNVLNHKQKSNKKSRLPLLSLSQSYLRSSTSFSDQSDQNKQIINPRRFKMNSQVKNQQNQHNQQIYDQSINKALEQKAAQTVQVAKLAIGIFKNIQTKKRQYTQKNDPNYVELKQKYNEEYPQQIKEISSKLKKIQNKFLLQ